MDKICDIALIQMTVTDDKTVNNTTAVRLIRTACQKYQPRCVVLPEYFNVPVGKCDLILHAAEKVPTGETCILLRKLATELKIYLVCGTIVEIDERDTTKLYNTTIVFGPDGNLLVRHRQLHLVKMLTNKRDITKLTKLTTTMETIKLDDCEMLRRHDGCLIDDDKTRTILTVGDKLTTFDLDGIKVGLCIGTDILYGCLMTKYREIGCDMLMCITSMPDAIGKLCMEKVLCVRALETQCIVLGVTTARKEGKDYITSSKSLWVDGCGDIVVKTTGTGDEILLCKCDMKLLREVRTVLPIFDCRRTDLYETIIKC